ncbi:MAG TPA: hypothetical protein VNY07_12195 [Chthoniobacterales bacterium]|jgi:hypothetical protein|nr:hypothetical protein [Chthoniobacterales bacterium]
MKKSINDNRKRRGRPATGTAPLVGVRMTEEFQSEIKNWAKKQPDHPALAVAIRRLVELGLTAKAKWSPVKEDEKPRKDTKGRARELAGDTLDEMTDTTATPEDQAGRKRRLIRGPEEFQNVRRDRPNRK